LDRRGGYAGGNDEDEDEEIEIYGGG